MPDTSAPPTTTSTPSTTTRPTTATTPDGEGAAQAALVSCRAEVAAGQGLAAAAAASARDWRMHADAQHQLDAGKISYARAEKLWATSKAPSVTDLKNFAAASAAYAKAKGPCGALTRVATGTSVAPEATACRARGVALADLATAGTRVNSQWAEHVALMRTKAHAGPDYHEKWMAQVGDSTPVLAAYDKAAAALAKAPACR